MAKVKKFPMRIAIVFILMTATLPFKAVAADLSATDTSSKPSGQAAIVNGNDASDVDKDKRTLLDSVRLSLGKKQFEQASSSLKAYQKKYGMDDNYLLEKARLFALTNRTNEASGLVHVLSAKYPDNQQIEAVKNILLKQKKDSLGSKESPVQEEYKSDLSAPAEPEKQKVEVPTSPNPQPKEITASEPPISSEQAIEWVKRAEKEMGAQNYVKAGQAFQRAADYQKNDAVLYFHAAQAYALAEKRNDALIMLNNANRIDPENVIYLKARARMASKDEEKHEGVVIESYQKILKKDPGYTPALLRLGEYQANKRNYKEASKYYGQVLAQNPNNKFAAIKAIQLRMWETDYAGAKASLDNYKARFGEDNQYVTEQARLLSLTNHPKEAIALVDAQFQVDPTNVDLPKIKTQALETQKFMATHPEEKPAPPLVALARKLYGQKKYQEALQAYQKYLKENPKDKVTFLEMVQVSVVSEQYEKGKNLLAQYLKTFGEDDGYLTEKARYFAFTNHPKEALAITRALLKKHPNDAALKQIQEYALKHKEGVGGNGQEAPQTPEEQALECIHKLVAKEKLTAAALAYCRFTAQYPMNRAAWTEFASVESWRGNYRASLRILACYCRLFGATEEYLKLQARVLANAGRANCALSIICPMLRTQPNDYDLNYTLALAQYYNNQPGYMCDTLNWLKCMYPEGENAKMTKDLKQYIATPYRSNVVLDLYHSRDTDTVDIVRGILSVNIFRNPCTKYFVNVREERVSADVKSGLEPIEGGNGLNLTSAVIGVNKRINAKLGLEGAVGAAHLADNHNSPIYRFNANIKPEDAWVFDWTEAFDYYDVSARALSLDVRQQLHQITFAWEPCIQRYLLGRVYYANYSDSNSQWFVNLAPKIGVIRTEIFNFTVGLSGQWDGFSLQPGNGYYTPRFYQYYAVTADAYFSQSDNVGYSLELAIGQQKDETFSSFKFAGDIGVNAFFGIYRNWMLVLSAEGSNRGRSIADNTQPNKPYQVYAIQATITKRFE